MEREVTDFARRNPGVVVYVNPRPCAVPRIVAEYREWGRVRVGGGGIPACPLGSTCLISDLAASTHSHFPLPVNGAVREENVNSKSVEEITSLVQKLADQSGLDVIRIRKPFHTDNPSIQGQWHPFTNKRTALHGLRPRELQDSAPASI